MTRDASAPTAAGGCLTDRTIMPALPELILRHARSPRTKAVMPTRKDTCEAQRAANTTKRSASKRHKLQESYRGKDNNLEFT
jgi:hypothetical protein